jgi:Domain of unknown function (DUF4304)
MGIERVQGPIGEIAVTEVFSPQDAFKEVLKTVFEVAPMYGYKKSGKLIKKIANGNAVIAEFQGSRDSTKYCVKFTLNLSVVSGEMLKIDGLKYPFGKTLKTANAHDGHLELRIGHIVYGHDKWWEIDKTTDIEKLISELREAIYHKAIPYMENFFRNEDLFELWVSNGFHGLTLTMRDKYIEAMKKIIDEISQ